MIVAASGKSSSSALANTGCAVASGHAIAAEDFSSHSGSSSGCSTFQPASSYGGSSSIFRSGCTVNRWCGV